ncbi:hypothetical protein D3C80_1287270 [compost metagenome]
MQRPFHAAAPKGCLRVRFFNEKLEAVGEKVGSSQIWRRTYSRCRQTHQQSRKAFIPCLRDPQRNQDSQDRRNISAQLAGGRSSNWSADRSIIRRPNLLINQSIRLQNGLHPAAAEIRRQANLYFCLHSTGYSVGERNGKRIFS